MTASDNEVVVAINDLARIVLALNGEFESTSEAIRRLNEFGIPPARIAAILNLPTNRVTSALAKSRKRKS